MQILLFFASLFPLLLATPLAGNSDYSYEDHLEVLYNTLDRNSLSELFAFYNLYGETRQGRKAFSTAWDLINKHRPCPIKPLLFKAFAFDIHPIISLVTKEANEVIPPFSEHELQGVETIADHLANRKLKGHYVWKTSELVDLSEEEVDLARALLIHEFQEDRLAIRSYEAYLDMMSLQILSRLPKNPSHIQILEAINHFIFHEMRYRFPPHSMWVKEADLYTFLPSILDSRHGVCLGVSILYLSLAQRLNLPLTIITPPGHIFLSYNGGGEKINIETTARGIHMPDEVYLSINTKELRKESLKSVIGMNYFNAAGEAWRRKNFAKAIECYEIASIYLTDYPTLHYLLGLSYLFQGSKEIGEAHLKKAQLMPMEDLVYRDTSTEDYFKGEVDEKGLLAMFAEVNETRDSIETKQKSLQEVLHKFPRFREGLFHLAITYLQLNRTKEALEILKQYHKIDSENPTVEYYLTLLSLQRLEFRDAWTHFFKCKEVTGKKHHTPQVLKQLERTLKKTAPLH